MAIPAAAGEVVGRAVERAKAAAFLERSTRALEVLHLVGEPGIGKTALWEEILELARPRIVLAHRASQVEARLSFSGLSDLLSQFRGGGPAHADLIPTAIAMLPAPRRRALEAALLLREPDAETADARRLGLAVES